MLSGMIVWSRRILYSSYSRPGISHLSKEPKIEYERRVKGQRCSQGTAKFQLKLEGEELNQRRS